jgi:STE24 endopeptidase
MSQEASDNQMSHTVQNEPSAQTDETASSTEGAGALEEAPSMDQIKAYHRAKRRVHLGGIAISLVYWIAWVLAAGTFVSWLYGYVDSRWIALFITAGVMLGLNVLINLPLDYYSSYTLEHRFNLSNQTPKSWFVFQFKSWGLGLIIGGAILAGLYAALWYTGWLWGVYVWAGVMVFSILLAKLFPLVILPLFYPAQPLDRPELAERLEKLAGEAGMKISGIYDLALSKDTKKANAMLAGLGSTRRVYLADTLLESFGNDQIAVVFAHELGHHIRGHIYKLIVMSAVVTSLLVGLIWWRLNPHAGTEGAWTGAVAAFAEIMLISTVFPLIIGPITNGISRYFERQADWDALRLTDDPKSFRGAFEKLIKINLADPNPPQWEEIMFDDHPMMSKRLAMADHYAEQRQHAQGAQS